MPYEISEEVVERKLGDRLVLLQLETGEYHTLNDAGVIVWEAMRAGKGEAEMVERMAREYDAPREVLAGDVAACLRLLRERQLVIWRGE